MSRLGTVCLVAGTPTRCTSQVDRAGAGVRDEMTGEFCSHRFAVTEDVAYGQDPWLLPFVQKGWHVVNMTSGPGRGTASGAVDDAACALRWVVDHAAEYGLDTNQIEVSGGSAGGHLALVAGMAGSREVHPCCPGGSFRVGVVVNRYGIPDIESLDAYLNESIQENR